jgi:hypothetical protein
MQCRARTGRLATCLQLLQLEYAAPTTTPSSCNQPAMHLALPVGQGTVTSLHCVEPLELLCREAIPLQWMA